MVDIKLNSEKSGYDAIGEYIRRYWEHNIPETVICYLGTSYDGITYEYKNEAASPCGYLGNDIEFLYDWWEGERYIKLFGIKGVSEFDVSGGIYTEDEDVLSLENMTLNDVGSMSTRSLPRVCCERPVFEMTDEDEDWEE